MNKRRTTIYIDGFNWYHGIFKHRPEWKWLNIQTFFEDLRQHDEISHVYFFTALVDENIDSGQAQIRQLKYHSALADLPKVSVVLGSYQALRTVCRSRCREPFIIMQEKQTDVGIAVQMMADAMHQTSDVMCLVSGDTDIHPALRWIAANRPKISLTNYIPALPRGQKHRRLDQLGASIRCKVTFLPLEKFVRHQFPDSLRLASGETISKPATWVKTT